MPLRFERSHQFQRIELIITASVGPVWSGQHLEHNAQRQNAPTHSTRYSAITIALGVWYRACFSSSYVDGYGLDVICLYRGGTEAV